MDKLGSSALAWLIFVAAAALEIGGDAVIRKGLRGNGWAWIGCGGLLLASYGLVVNTVKWDFSKLIGAYVGVFALVSVLVGRLAFQENVGSTTWIGLGIIIVGGMVIQFGAN
jgi:drug/metabolite transporter superfamily protein YnfA